MAPAECGAQRNPDLHPRAAPRLRFDVDTVPQQPHAFVDADQSETGSRAVASRPGRTPCRRRRSTAAHRPPCASTSRRRGVRRHASPRCGAPPGRCDRGTGRYRPSTCPMSASARVGDRDRLQLLELGAEHAQRRDQAGVLEQAGMQVVGDVPDFLGQGDGVPLHRRQREQDVGLLRLVEELALEAADHDRQAGDPLADIVMEIPGDARALGFLRRNQPPEQIRNLPVARLQPSPGSRASPAPPA